MGSLVGSKANVATLSWLPANSRFCVAENAPILKIRRVDINAGMDDMVTITIID
jgi:hypothetical protein